MGAGQPAGFLCAQLQFQNPADGVAAPDHRIKPGMPVLLVVAAVPTLIVLSGLNIMAKHESGKARRELAARGLLVYDDL